MTCARCYIDWISCGLTSVEVVSVSLDGEITYFLFNKGATYSGTSTVSAGAFTIEEPYPNAFNPYSGAWVLYLDGSCYAPLFCDEYPCIQFEARNGGADKTSITCCATATHEEALITESDNFIIQE